MVSVPKFVAALTVSNVIYVAVLAAAAVGGVVEPYPVSKP